jgi:ectoine hydroxylase-related dioxygenase (phytanoyl-CoA dioxygenase family)
MIGTALQLIDSTPLLGSPTELRARGARDGYLFFRSLIPSEEVAIVRTAVLEALERNHWVSGPQGTLRAANVASIPDEDLRADIGISGAGYLEVQKIEALHALPHHPRLISLYEQLFAEPVFVHPRHIVRVMTSHPSLHPTPPHQDYPLVQGSENTWTAWFPLGDAPQTLGPLAVLPGSHRNGYIPIRPAEGAGSIEAQLCRGEDNWTSTDFRAGDVLTFPSYTVHKAIPATDRDHVRLSMDVRYQPVSEPIEEKSLQNHSGYDWDQVYSDWHSSSLKYYWRSETPRLSPWDDELMQPAQRIC